MPRVTQPSGFGQSDDGCTSQSGMAKFRGFHSEQRGHLEQWDVMNEKGFSDYYLKKKEYLFPFS